MSKIMFKGQEYNSVDEMPLNVRKEYDELNGTPADPKLDASQLYSNLEQIPPDVRPIYDRVMGRIEDDKKKSASSTSDLPSVKDMMGHGDPSEIERARSEETLFKPSPPLDAGQINPAQGNNPVPARLVVFAVLLMIILGAAFVLVAR